MGFPGSAGRLMVTAAIAALLCACNSDPPGGPNLLIVTLDTFRADVLSTYGCRRDLAPGIDAFADKSVVFENATTPIGTTLPAHASLFTGLYPRHHGVRWNGHSLAREYTTMAEVLSGAGYETAAFVSKPSLLEGGGLGQGFRTRNTMPDDRHPRILGGDEVNEVALPWLAEQRSRPFFAWLHYFETHAPYRRTQQADREFRARGYSGPLEGGAGADLFYSLGGRVPWTPQERWAVHALYDGEVVETDSAVTQVLDTLRALDLVDDTVVVITSDHGQALGEHDVVGHGFLLFQPVIHVPLIIRDPRILFPSRVNTRVGLVDMLPTVVELLGIERLLPEIDGRSVAAALSGEGLPTIPYFAESRVVANHAWRTEDDAQALAVFLEHEKLFWRPDATRFVDLSLNPEELETEELLAPDEDQSALLELAAWYRERGDVGSEHIDLDPETRKELQSLGYIEQ